MPAFIFTLVFVLGYYDQSFLHRLVHLAIPQPVLQGHGDTVHQAS
jgi:hypothetical protein